MARDDIHETLALLIFKGERSALGFWRFPWTTMAAVFCGGDRSRWRAFFSSYLEGVGKNSHVGGT